MRPWAASASRATRRLVSHDTKPSTWGWGGDTPPQKRLAVYGFHYQPCPVSSVPVFKRLHQHQNTHPNAWAVVVWQVTFPEVTDSRLSAGSLFCNRTSGLKQTWKAASQTQQRRGRPRRCSLSGPVEARPQEPQQKSHSTTLFLSDGPLRGQGETTLCAKLG